MLQYIPCVTPIHHWENPNRLWSRLHLDFAGPFIGKMFLIVVDSYSKWLEIHPVLNSVMHNTICKLTIMFSTHGLPKVVVTDNASCFKSEEFGEFMRINYLKHMTGALYHPSTNGLTEMAVQTLKKLLETNTSRVSIDTLISRFLFTYRITSQSVTGVPPAICSQTWHRKDKKYEYI